MTTNPSTTALSPATTRDDRAEPRSLRQWVNLGIGVVVLVALCLIAGRWQWNRYVTREAQIDTIDANYHADPVPIGDVLSGPGDVVDPDDVWRPATLTGHYEEDKTVLLRNRPVGGTGGFHVLVPFVTDGSDGGPRVVMIVDRGFVATSEDASTPDAIPAPPTGEDVEATVTLRGDEPTSGRKAPPAQVQAISTEQVLAAAPGGAAWADGLTVGAYGALRSEDPAPAGTLRALPAPDIDPGSHLSYAFQWCVFAAGAILGFLALVRRERRETVTAGDLLGEQRSGQDRQRKRGPTAEQEEDALIEAQLR